MQGLVGLLYEMDEGAAVGGFSGPAIVTINSTAGTLILNTTRWGH